MGYSHRPKRGAVARLPSRGTRCADAGKVIVPPGWYVVQAGDSLWRISELHYRKGERWRVIRKANAVVRKTDVIHPCQRVFIPR